jgi:hypothetical protein
MAIDYAAAMLRIVPPGVVAAVEVITLFVGGLENKRAQQT